MAELKLLLEHSHDPAYQTLEGYKATGGYDGLTKAVNMEKQAVIDEIKASGLRGRGGAGFPAWIKWNGLPKDTPSLSWGAYIPNPKRGQYTPERPRPTGRKSRLHQRRRQPAQDGPRC